MNEFYTVREVSEILRVSEHTVRKLIRDKEIPHTQVGSSWRVPKSGLSKYIESNTHGKN